MKFWICMSSLNHDKLVEDYGSWGISKVYKEYRCKLSFGEGSFAKITGFKFDNEDDYMLFIMRYC